MQPGGRFFAESGTTPRHISSRSYSTPPQAVDRPWLSSVLSMTRLTVRRFATTSMLPILRRLISWLLGTFVAEERGVERFGPITIDQDGHRRSEFLGYENGTYTDRWVLKQLECLVGRSGVITELSSGRLFFVDCAPDGMRIDGTDTVCR
jgi:hypothetical protein